MIVNNATNTKSFIYCSVYQSPHETTNYFNNGNGHFHELIYIVEGSADYTISTSAELTGNETYTALIADQLYNIIDTKEKYVITKTNNIGASMVMFNPIPDTKQIQVEIVKGNKTMDLTAEDQRITVVCLTGSVTVKEKTLESMQYAVIFPNKSATLILPENTICALVTG